MGAAAAGLLGHGEEDGAGEPARRASSFAVRRMVYCGTESPAVVALELLEDGSVEEKQVVQNSLNPYQQKNGSPGGVAVEWVALHPGGKYLYALTSFWDKGKGEAVSYEVDQLTGLLSLAGRPCSTGGYQPCHADFSVGDFEGHWLAVAHYIDGVVSVFDCSTGALAPEPAGLAELPGERFKMGKHKGPLAHGVRFAPSGNFVAVCDAGQARICVYPFDGKTGSLGDVRILANCGAMTPGQGLCQRLVLKLLGVRPRHLAFHPRLNKVYVLTEVGNALSWHAFDPESGEIGPSEGSVRTITAPEAQGCLQNGSFLPAVNAASEVEVSADGKFVYVGNRALGRAEESIAVFAVDQKTGAASFVQSAAALGGPRHFALVRDGAGLLVGLQRGKAVALYAADRASGRLALCARSPVGHAIDCVATCELRQPS